MENGGIASPLELTDSVMIYDIAKKAAHLFKKIGRDNEGEYAQRLAYEMITGKTKWSYGYWIENGATTLWEDFVDKNVAGHESKNHHFRGDISSWFIQELAGLKLNPNAEDIRYNRVGLQQRN